jgi:hypothetical protein
MRIGRGPAFWLRLALFVAFLAVSVWALGDFLLEAWGGAVADRLHVVGIRNLLVMICARFVGLVALRAIEVWEIRNANR